MTGVLHYILFLFVSENYYRVSICIM